MLLHTNMPKHAYYSVCNKQSDSALWIRPEAYFLLTRSLNKTINIVPLTLDFRPGLSWSMAQSIFSSIQFKIICIALFTIQSMQSNFSEN